MTIPWMMNCAHSETGWCLECVVKLGNSHAELITALKDCVESLEYIERNHAAQVTGGFIHSSRMEKARAVLAKVEAHQ